MNLILSSSLTAYRSPNLDIGLSPLGSIFDISHPAPISYEKYKYQRLKINIRHRKGLTQARMAGARVAIGSVLVFLDSHCECVQDWLRPLLQRIKDKRATVPTPLIDVIEQDNFMYQPGNPVTFEVGYKLSIGINSKINIKSLIVFVTFYTYTISLKGCAD